MMVHRTGRIGSHQSVRNIKAEVSAPSKKKSKYFMILDCIANKLHGDGILYEEGCMIGTIKRKELGSLREALKKKVF